MNYIPQSEYEHLAPKEPGEFVRIREHVGCTGSSPAVKILRRNDGSIHCKCYRCDMFGSTRPEPDKTPAEVKAYLERLRGNGSTDKGAAPLCLPRDHSTSWSNWSFEGQSWLRGYGISEVETRKHGIGYSSFLNRVIIPCSGRDGRLLGYQARRLQYSDGPKYWTKRDEQKSQLYKFITNNKSDVLVICEDVMSAIKLSRYYNALAILGTQINPEALNIAIKFKEVIIYLDNDNAQVCQLQSRIKRRLEMLVPDVKLIKLDKDPKALTDQELINLTRGGCNPSGLRHIGPFTKLLSSLI